MSDDIMNAPIDRRFALWAPSRSTVSQRQARHLGLRWFWLATGKGLFAGLEML